MGKVPIVLALILIGVLAWRAWPQLCARLPDESQKLDGPERVQRARAANEAVIRGKFRAAGVEYPGEVFVRWFKQEAALELWARNAPQPFRMVASWPILVSSGKLGPKRRQGDLQVPEGFYEIDRFNPESLFHLSLGLNYPNASDRVLADPRNPGGDIFIHGKDKSVGCAPIGDAAIEELYLAALDARAGGQSRIAVHIFPARMSGKGWSDLTARNPKLAPFWAQLQPAFEAFERTRQLPKVTVENDGRYRMER